jgi:hypothetical protein
MDESTIVKRNEIRKCLLAVQRLGMDMAGLHSLNINLNYHEKHLLQSATSHLDHIATNLNGMLPVKKTEEPELVQEQKVKRSFGNAKL